MGVDYVVAIPSYRRPNVLRDKTLKWLLSSSVPYSKIHVFVANAEEAALYKEVHSNIVVGKLGITPQRRFIATYFPPGTCVVSIDDDVEGLYKCVDPKSKPMAIANVHKYFQEAFMTARKKGAYIWGVYPVLNPFYMKPKQVTTSLKFILGTLYGFIVRHEPALLPTLPEKEDFEQSILYYLRDGVVVRFSDVAVKTRFHNPIGGLGGLSAPRLKANEHAANELKRRYPNLGYVWHRKASGVAEFRFYANIHGVPTEDSSQAIRSCKQPRCLTSRKAKSPLDPASSRRVDEQRT